MTSSIPLSEMESSPSAKWENIGDRYVGRIVDLKQQQQTDTAGNPRNFPSGDPMMLWIITIEQSDGERIALWAKGGRFKVAKGEGEAMLTAIGLAVREAGADAVELGGELAVALTGEGERHPGKNPPNLFRAQYKAPTQNIPATDLFSE